MRLLRPSSVTTTLCGLRAHLLICFMYLIGREMEPERGDGDRSPIFYYLTPLKSTITRTGSSGNRKPSSQFESSRWVAATRIHDLTPILSQSAQEQEGELEGRTETQAQALKTGCRHCTQHLEPLPKAHPYRSGLFGLIIFFLLVI